MAVGSAGSDREIYIQYEREGELKRHPPAIVRTERDKSQGVASVGIFKYSKKEEYAVGFSCREEVHIKSFGSPRKDPTGMEIRSPAEAAGLKVHDRLVSIDGKPITLISDVLESVKRSEGKPLSIVVERDKQELTFTVTPELNEKKDRHLVGIQMIGNPVDQVDPNSEAFKEGLRKGAYLTFLMDKERKGELTISYIDSIEKDVEKDAKTFTIPRTTECGSTLVLNIRKGVVETLQAGTVGEAFGMAWADTLGHSTMVFIVLHRLITGDVDPKNLAGPVGMAGILTQVADERSFTYYLWFLALLSLNLGVLQFVPIPLLDGWHLLMVAVEKLKGSPVSLKIQEAFQYVGLVLILALLFWVTKNDIMRFFN